MKSKTLWFSVLVIFLLLSACGRAPNQPVQPIPIKVPPNTPSISAPATTVPTPFSPQTSTLLPTAAPPGNFGSLARNHLENLSGGINSRATGTSGCATAAAYIQNAFTQMGYAPRQQKFSYTDVTGIPGNGTNLIADKKGETDTQIIVGAHYDSYIGHGADDNASGVAVMLEAAQRLKDIPTTYSIRFITWDAEEVGFKGSQFYVNQMNQTEKDATLVYLNLDSLAVGDYTYIYGAGAAGIQIRDWSLEKLNAIGFNLITQQGLNPQYPAGTTGDFSDHAPFWHAGIPYVYFEATNWTLGDLDGYTQVNLKYGEAGEVWHTQYDTIDYINTTFPGRMDEHLNLFSTLLVKILTEYQE